jgi:RNA polymerase sigma-70 factor, ECF subfamily
MTDWHRIVEEHGPLVWRTVWRLTADEHDAADCYQETFLSVLEISRRERIRNLPALFRRVAVSRALDRLRRRIRRRDREQPLEDGRFVDSANPAPPIAAASGELADRLRDDLARLPDDQAEAFCLRFLDGLSYRQIAEQMGATPNAVGVMIHRARKQLQGILEPAIRADDR